MARPHKDASSPKKTSKCGSICNGSCIGYSAIIAPKYAPRASWDRVLRLRLLLDITGHHLTFHHSSQKRIRITCGFIYPSAANTELDSSLHVANVFQTTKKHLRDRSGDFESPLRTHKKLYALNDDVHAFPRMAGH